MLWQKLQTSFDFTWAAVDRRDSATFLFPVPVPKATIFEVRTTLFENSASFLALSSNKRSLLRATGGGCSTISIS